MAYSISTLEKEARGANRKGLARGTASAVGEMAKGNKGETNTMLVGYNEQARRKKRGNGSRGKKR